ncbi:MAG: Uma2 family endonuclease [Chloroflexi bacterium]|nr:Uma2 family endonuclease [Chloroflexota bacterium]
MVAQPRLLTVEDFEAFLALPQNKDRLLELIHGAVSEKLPTEEHGLIVSNFVTALTLYARQTKAGRVGVEVRHRLPEDAHNSRLPDVSFTMAKRPLVKQGSVPHLPDVVVEVKSPDDGYNQMRDKAKYYTANGVRLAILVFPEKRFVEVYAPGVDVEILFEHETISGRDVLPGFTLAVKEVFQDALE